MFFFFEQRAQILASVFSLEKCFDHRDFIGAFKCRLRCLLRHRRCNAAGHQISGYARFAEASVVAPPTGEGVGEALVV